jgi:hypothetical protein
VKKRYTSAAEIEAAIDKAKKKANDLLREAEACELAIKEFRKGVDRSEYWSIDEHSKIAKHCRRRASRLLDKQLKNLSMKLAEFNTEIMRPIIDDPSIPVRVKPDLINLTEREQHGKMDTGQPKGTLPNL